MICKPTDPCYVFNGRLRSMSNSMVTVRSITSDVRGPSESQLQKRSKFEAGQRAFDVLSDINAFAKVPFFRPYIYALNALTYGLILIDPLDRLE